MPDDKCVGFNCYETVAGAHPEEDARELKELADKLCAADDTYRYLDDDTAYVPPASRGYTVRDVLPELNGKPFDNLAMALIHSLRPSRVRVSYDGVITCDAVVWRVTVFLEPVAVTGRGVPTIMKVSQEVEVGYGTGYDITQIIQHRYFGGHEPRPSNGCFGNVEALARVNFS